MQSESAFQRQQIASFITSQSKFKLLNCRGTQRDGEGGRREGRGGLRPEGGCINDDAVAAFAVAGVAIFVRIICCHKEVH